MKPDHKVITANVEIPAVEGSATVSPVSTEGSATVPPGTLTLTDFVTADNAANQGVTITYHHQRRWRLPWKRQDH